MFPLMNVKLHTYVILTLVLKKQNHYTTRRDKYDENDMKTAMLPHI